MWFVGIVANCGRMVFEWFQFLEKGSQNGCYEPQSDLSTSWCWRWQVMTWEFEERVSRTLWSTLWLMYIVWGWWWENRFCATSAWSGWGKKATNRKNPVLFSLRELQSAVEMTMSATAALAKPVPISACHRTNVNKPHCRSAGRTGSFWQTLAPKRKLGCITEHQAKYISLTVMRHTPQLRALKIYACVNTAFSKQLEEGAYRVPKLSDS
jgi:hypothetical protein